MHQFGLRAIIRKPGLSLPREGYKKYPFQLRGKEVSYPKQVWATDMTYTKLPSGFVYLMAIVDVFSRNVISWRLSNSIDATFCVTALRVAIERYGVPAIFIRDWNTLLPKRRASHSYRKNPYRW